MDIDYTVGEVELSYKPKFKNIYKVTVLWNWVERGRAATGRLQPEQDVQQRRLSGTVRTD